MDTKKISHLEVNYRNLEKVYIPEQCILGFQATGVTTEIKSHENTFFGKQEVVGYLKLQIEKFDTEEATQQSHLYSNSTPYERLLQDTTVDAITIFYKDEEFGQELRVPYDSDSSNKLGENTLLDIKEQVIEQPYKEDKDGVVLEFNKQEKIYK